MLNVKAEFTKDPFFDLIQSLTIDFMEVAFYDSGSTFRPTLHSHNWFDISYVMNGTLRYEIDGKSYDVSKGELVMVAPGKIHRETGTPGIPYEVMFLCLKLSKDGIPFNLAEYLGIEELECVSKKENLQGTFETILHEIAYREEGYLLKLNAQIYDLLVEIRRGVGRPRKAEPAYQSIHLRKEKLIHDVIHYLEEHWDQKISMSQLSKMFFLSIPYLSTSFKRQTGNTLVEYMNRIKINKSKALLLSGMEVSEVWERAGYSNIHYFYKVFKQYAGMTPMQFIKEIAAQQMKKEQ